MDEPTGKEVFPLAVPGGGFGVTKTLAVVFPLAFLLQLYATETSSVARVGRDSLSRFFGLTPSYTFSRQPAGPPAPAGPSPRFRIAPRVWQPATAIFLHPDFPSVLLSLLLLFLFGAALENYLGGPRFFALFLSSGILGYLSVWLFFRERPAAAASIVGPLPAFLGILAAHAALLPNRRVSLFGVPLSSWTVSFSFGALAIAGSYVFSGRDLSCLAAAGAVPFALLATAWEPLWRPLFFRIAMAREAWRLGDEAAVRQRLDAILEKIHSQGFERLSFRERAFLRVVGRRFDGDFDEKPL